MSVNLSVYSSRFSYHIFAIGILSMTQYTIRFLQSEDTPQIMKFISQITPIPISEEALKGFCSKRYLSLVAVKNNEVVGVYLSYRNWVSKYSLKRDGCIFIFGVDKKHRKRGLGSAILQTGNALLRYHYECVGISGAYPKKSKESYDFLTKKGIFSQRVIPNHFGDEKKREDAIYFFGDLDNYEIPDDSDTISISPEIREFATIKEKTTLMNRIFGKP